MPGGTPPSDGGLNEQLAGLRPGQHLCLIHESPKDWRATAIPFLLLGPERGEKCIYLSDAHTADQIRRFLREEGCDVAALEASGRLLVSPAAEVYAPDDAFDPQRMFDFLISQCSQAIAEGYRGLRGAAEMSWALRGMRGSEKLIEYEALLNSRVFRDQPLLVICQYDRSRFDPEVVQSVIRTHPMLAWGGRIYRNTYYIPPERFLNRRPAEAEVQGWLENLEQEREHQQEEQQLLRASEQRYRELFENAGDIVFSCDLQGNITAVSQAVRPISGYTPEELLGTNIEQYVPPEYLDLTRKMWEGRITRRAPAVFELEALGRDGRRIPLEVNSWIICQDGQPAAVHGIARDITERKQAERRLLESQVRLQLLNSISTGITAHLSTDQIIARALLEISVYFPAYRIAYSTIDEQGRMTVTHSVEPPGMPSLAGMSGNLGSAPQYLDALRRRESGIVEDVAADPRLASLAEIFSASGVRSVLDVPVQHSDKLVGLLCFDSPQPRRWSDHEIATLREVAEDLSVAIANAGAEQERRQAEEALRASEAKLQLLMEQIPAVVWTTDSELRFTSSLGAALANIGLRPDQVVGMTLFEYFQTSDPQFRPIAASYRALGGESDTINMDWLGRTFQAHFEPLRDAQGRIAGSIGVALDITERLRLEEDLRQSQKMEALGRLAGGVAHDFNNLLTVILGYGHLLVGRLKSGGAARADAEEILKAAERASALTNDLLAFSRRRIVQPRILDLNSLVADMDKMLRRLIGERIELETALDPDLGSVKADPGQIQQVILNLAANARDAMPDGGAMTLQTANARPGNDQVILAISDTGSGMDAETAAHLFEPFFTTKELGKGTGLGLSIVYGIVKQCGGNIDVRTEPGQGSKFEIYLPRVEDTGEPEAPSSAAARAAQGWETILLVEDAPEVRRLARRALLHRGYTVLEALDSQDAIRICRQHADPIHLLLTDVVMPQIDGPALAENLLAMRWEMKALFMSGYAEELSPGAAFLAKPFTPEGLARKVRDVLDRAC